ncbi:hypothetical protein BHE74_00041994 [Ensete ventricosum]|nr:hypothetical protein BHE74_00041994 [Ensete ventricosum]
MIWSEGFANSATKVALGSYCFLCSKLSPLAVYKSLLRRSRVSRVVLPKPCGTSACPSAKVSLSRDLPESLRLTKEKTGQKKQFPRDPQATAQANTSHSHMKITSMDITNSESTVYCILRSLVEHSCINPKSLAFGYLDEKPIDIGLMKFLGLCPSALSWYLEFAFAFSTSSAPFTTNALHP